MRIWGSIIKVTLCLSCFLPVYFAQVFLPGVSHTTHYLLVRWVSVFMGSVSFCSIFDWLDIFHSYRIFAEHCFFRCFYLILYKYGWIWYSTFFFHCKLYFGNWSSMCYHRDHCRDLRCFISKIFVLERDCSHYNVRSPFNFIAIHGDRWRWSTYSVGGRFIWSESIGSRRLQTLLTLWYKYHITYEKGAVSPRAMLQKWLLLGSKSSIGRSIGFSLVTRPESWLKKRYSGSNL